MKISVVILVSFLYGLEAQSEPNFLSNPGVIGNICAKFHHNWPPVLREFFGWKDSGDLLLG